MENYWQARAVRTNVNGTSKVTIVPASGDATTYRDITKLIIDTAANAAVCVLSITDGSVQPVGANGGNMLEIQYPASAAIPGAPLVLDFNPPLAQQAANTAWTIQASANASGFQVTAMYVERQ